eukprot:TRINITY_DN10477_c0_g1_i2.p1 TRINITY_DN10477_c0_g1~~TRINITY_DN10477_c0_g1_i2.p1  ORF type:complete len:149 (+),score=10.47 TRINITY_DN10477_c0_g1_i2:108-554(+)
MDYHREKASKFDSFFLLSLGLAGANLYQNWAALGSCSIRLNVFLLVQYIFLFCVWLSIKLGIFSPAALLRPSPYRLHLHLVIFGTILITSSIAVVSWMKAPFENCFLSIGFKLTAIFDVCVAITAMCFVAYVALFSQVEARPPPHKRY